MSSAVSGRRTFPLVPRKQSSGLPLGEVPGRRRGHGSNVIGHRLYQPGDPVARIDWRASARLATASGSDVFIVREQAADEAPRVVIVVDRRPEMSLYPAPLPWLHKHAALREAADAIAASAAAARADTAALDLGGGEEWWVPPGRRDRRWLIAEREGGDAPFAAPPDGLERSFEFLTAHRRELPPGSFVFVLSDFLTDLATESWLRAISHGWDIVPVVIQDPVWEQSFPAVGGIGVPIADPRSGVVALVRLSRRQAARRCVENEQRLVDLLVEFGALGLQPVVLGTSDPDGVDAAFIAWAEQRRSRSWGR
ncbi:MAG TPA: DUF58 domain-containing protein [Solirubrobacteraceae bacterium]|nr:DUF58 domain-containing protein [Solirubrobacteraceae bacterium]